MPEWIVTLFGESLAQIVWVVVVAAMVCLLAVVLIVIARKVFASGGLPVSFKNRTPRLAVLDTTRIDEKRRLVLVRRDEVEHLILIGGQTDIVVEPGILRLPASNIEQVDTRSKGLAGPDTLREPAVSHAVPHMDGVEREIAPNRGGRETPAPRGNSASIAPRIDSPIASPAPAPAPGPVQTSRRATAAVRLDRSAATTASAADAVAAGSDNKLSKTQGDRISARLANPIENATAALAAAMPGLMRSRSSVPSDSASEKTVATASPPRSLATPTLATSTAAAPPATTTSTLTSRADGSALSNTLDTQPQRSYSQSSTEPGTPPIPERDRVEHMIAVTQTDDTLAAETSSIPAEHGDRRRLSTLPTASALGESRLAAVSAAGSESESARLGRRTEFDAPASSSAVGERRTFDGAFENSKTDSPRMPLSVKSFATAIQNRKAPHSPSSAPRAPAPKPTEVPSSTSTEEDMATAPRNAASSGAPATTTSSDAMHDANKDGAPASSSQPHAGSMTDPDDQAVESRVPHLAAETAHTPPSAAPAPAAWSDMAEDGELEDFPSAERVAAFDEGDEITAPSTPPQASRVTLAGEPDLGGDHPNSASSPAPSAAHAHAHAHAHTGAGDRPSARVEPPTEQAEFGDVANSDAPMTSAPPVETERSGDAVESTSNWTSKSDSAETATAASTSMPIQERSDGADTEEPETDWKVDWPTAAAPAVSLDATGEPKSAPLVELTSEMRPSRLGAAPAVSLDQDGMAPTSEAPSPRPMETPRVEMDRMSRRDDDASVSSEDPSNEKPDDTPETKASSDAMKLQSTRKQPVETARPKLSLEEEMERLLGDFSFDEPVSRDR